MRSIVAIILVVIALLVVACDAQTNTKPEARPIIPTTTAPETIPPLANPPAGDTADGVVTGTDKIFGEVNTSTALGTDEIICDLAAKQVTFTFVNNDNKTWEMDQQLGWNPPNDKVNIHVLFNSYEVNGRNQYINDGVKYFGPNWPFSANCGGVEELAPGERAICTLTPVPIKSTTGLSQGLNEIFIKTPTSSDILQFTCK